MADTSTIASLATAGGTLVLAMATFSSTRSANRSAAHHRAGAQGGAAPGAVQRSSAGSAAEGRIRATITGSCCATGSRPCRSPRRTCISRSRCAMSPPGWPCCTAGTFGPSGWRRTPRRPRSRSFAGSRATCMCPPATSASGRRRYAIPAMPLYEPLREAIAARSAICVDILYGDHEGGQRTITRFHRHTAHPRRRRGVVVVDLLDGPPLEPRPRRPALEPRSLVIS